VWKQYDEPLWLWRLREDGRGRHEEEEDDEYGVGGRQEDEKAVEVGVLAPGYGKLRKNCRKAEYNK
jgi:hypothetical protein